MQFSIVSSGRARALLEEPLKLVMTFRCYPLRESFVSFSEADNVSFVSELEGGNTWAICFQRAMPLKYKSRLLIRVLYGKISNRKQVNSFGYFQHRGTNKQIEHKTSHMSHPVQNAPAGMIASCGALV